MGRVHRRRLEAGIVYKEFPARRNKLPVPEHRESVAMTASRLGNLGPDAAQESLIAEAFPVFSLQSRALAPETSSPQTHSTAIQSVVAETSGLHPGTD